MILLLTGLLTVVLGAVAAGAMNAMVLSRWEAPGSESVQVQELLARDHGTGNANLVLLVSGAIDDPATAAAATAVATELRGEQAVGDVWSYWSRGGDPTMRSSDGRHAVILAHVTGDATSARLLIRERILPTYTRDDGVLRVDVGGAEAVSSQVSQQATRDFLRAELLILPVMTILLVWLYRRVRLALLTLAIGLFAVLGTLAGLRMLTGFTEVATFAANITLVMGIGLGIDYSLFVIARFREELTAGATIKNAIISTVRTAGRTVVFSGLTVAASLSALLLFPFAFLRSFAYAGILVVALAVLGALTILPAALAVLGPRALRRNPRPEADDGFWVRAGGAVMRRPVLFAAFGLLVVGVLAAPALGLRLGLPDDRVLPPTASTRQTYDVMRDVLPTEPQDALHIVTTSTDVAGYAAEVSRVPGIAQVNAAAGVFVGGVRVGPAPFTGSRLEAVPTREILSGTETPALVAAVRAVPQPPGGALVGGYPAELTDFRAMLTDRIPLVAAVLLAISFAVLFAMSRSLLIPVKATVLNLLSLAVMFGVLVTVFQNGFLAGVLGFTPIGTLDPAFPILMFCVAYGLSMDYEVFLLSRIKERYDATGDNTRAVLEGLQRSAPLVTAAAAILAVSFALYATGEVMYLQMVGVGTAVAIIVDATIIRAILVPALMRLAGRANWWPARPAAPRPHAARLTRVEALPGDR
ncbi:membrane protein [Actinoplanes italicus]|uniref:MMPL family transporter n=1 Tax=Actinoplanes italicus TaxID=113567 RepID=UPI001943B52D|nr:MMPL family transporter [Actinoplanes italicus]GIE30904.1 membrane protein [Actinoplanes italicus]